MKSNEGKFMEHFSILIDQHKNIRNLLQAVQKKIPIQERTELLKRILTEINAHTLVEERHVYPVLENFEPLKREVYGFWREHERLRQELHSVIAVAQDERQFQNQMVRLSQTFEEHIKEEENRIFPEASKVVPKEELKKIDRNIAISVEQTKKVA